MELAGALLEGVVDRLTRPDYRASEAQLRSSGRCARPVRLRGLVEVCDGHGGLQAGGPRFDRHPSIGEADDLVGACRERPSETFGLRDVAGGVSAMAQRLWLTTSTLCPSGSRTNAP